VLKAAALVATCGSVGLCRLAVLLTAVSIMGAGCADLRRQNTADLLEIPTKTHHDHHVMQVLKTSYFYPVRDWVERPLTGSEAWNVRANGSVPDGSFYTDRDLGSLSPADLARGPCTEVPPQPPFTVDKFSRRGPRTTFFGTDSLDRRYLFKLDHADWPELASGAEIIASRLVWALGYHVPANYLVRIEGTGRSDLDGRRAVASMIVPGHVEGRWKFDWLRYRREMRALRLACAWLNDVDRAADNTLVAVHDDRADYYLLDFDSALGSWQGRPKPAWRGWRYVWDVEWQFRKVATLGRDAPGYNADQPIVSRAVGRFDAAFDPLTWRPQLPNSAFNRMTDQDASWMARKLAAFTRGQLEAVVDAARFTRAGDGRYILETLLARRQAILQIWPTDKELGE